jgi:hypothetical protein
MHTNKSKNVLPTMTVCQIQVHRLISYRYLLNRNEVGSCNVELQGQDAA